MVISPFGGGGEPGSLVCIDSSLGLGTALDHPYEGKKQKIPCTQRQNMLGQNRTKIWMLEMKVIWGKELGEAENEKNQGR